MRSVVEEVIFDSVEGEDFGVVFDEYVCAFGDHFVEDGGSVTRCPSAIGEDEHFWGMVLFSELDIFVLWYVIVEEDLRDEFRDACALDIFDTAFEKLRVIFDMFGVFGTERKDIDVYTFDVVDGMMKRLSNVVVVTDDGYIADVG